MSTPAGNNSGSDGEGSGGHGGGMSPEEFRVALGELRRAIGAVRGESEHIAGLIGQVEARFEAAQTHWQSPAAATAEVMTSWFARASHDLEELLREMAHRMETAYDNYASAEQANTTNSGG
ncbi:WXG100 family type VII secretion target [Streptomyces sp. BBFR25]|uniref:WXG100 family type VII secretion target n=1 Tax=Streptomyces sp. BBFR25 TaxID=3372855 RepID=UPI0037DC4F4D